MQVNLYANFRQHAGVKTFVLDLPAGTSVHAAIRAILAYYPSLRQHWINAQGDLHAHVHVFVNGDEVPTLPASFDTPLQPDDILDFFPVAGG